MLVTRKQFTIGGLVALGLILPLHASQTIDRTAVVAAPAGERILAPTPHPRVPVTLSKLWFAPDEPKRVSGSELSGAMRQVSAGEYTRALAVLSRPSLHQGVLGPYAMYDMAFAQLKLGRIEEARRAFKTIQDRKPLGYLGEAAAIGEAECDEAKADWSGAVSIYERLLKGKPLAPDDLLMRLGRAARRAGQTTKANDAFVRVYYEFALSAAASEAAAELSTVNLQPIEPGSERFKLELGRAERLFAARQYSPARGAFQTLQASARGDDRELVDLRLAEVDFYQKRPRDAREAVRPYLTGSSRQAEALYFHAVAARALGEEGEYARTVRRIADDFAAEPWAAEALGNLGAYYVQHDQDEKADAIYRELLDKHPRSAFSERAAWKVGWRAYRERHYRETVTYFERASADFPRSDFRPGWLYWAGRAREELKETAAARERYDLVLADYANTYYGRLTLKRPGIRPPVPRVIAHADARPEDGEGLDGAAPPPNAALIRALTAAGLHDKASSELRYAQRTWGDSPAIQATLAWVSYEQGIATSGKDRFGLLRGSITMMRRAYPQFMAAGGEEIPHEILAVIFPLAYWDQIQKYSTSYGLDPYLVAALVAQESTFVADVRSSANAVGLMQLIPSTARGVAKKLGIRYSARILTDPDINIRLGTTYFSDKMKEFGSAHLALAAYNAGERAVRRWRTERPDVPVDEFIDDIPYPETQNYVKRILGTADDYRRIYGK